MATQNGLNLGLSGSTGTGNFVGSTSPTMVTPVLGVSTATSIDFGGGALNSYVPLTSWTPVFTFATPGDLSVSYTNQKGFYVRIGGIVVLEFQIQCIPTFITSSGDVSITGLPITSNSTSGSGCRGIADNDNLVYPAGATMISGIIASNSNSIGFAACGSTIVDVRLSTANIISGSTIALSGSITYFV